MLHAVLDFFNSTAFHIGHTPTSWAEIFGFVTGLASVALVAINRISNFVWGMLNAVFFLILFYNAHLFADGTLQIMFFVLNALGLWAWLKAGPNRTPLRVQWAGAKQWVITSLGMLAIFAIEVPILRHVGDTYVIADAAILAGSVGAQYLMSLKRFENWFLWIAVDFVSIPLYFLKGLLLTGIVYILFLSLCFVGLFQWNRLREGKIEDEVVVKHLDDPNLATIRTYAEPTVGATLPKAA
jgi:nicotinamide mononucleotide transporter